MKNVYIVLERIPYEGDTVMRVYDNRDDAEAHAKYLEESDPSGYFEYKVQEEKVHIHVPEWSLANDDHR